MVMRQFPAVVISLLLFACAAAAQPEPQGLLIYEAPATTYVEAMPFRSFRQDNALYSTVVTAAGERKQLKSGGVLAVVPYPPVSFGPGFDEVAHTAIDKVTGLSQSYPSVRHELEQVRQRWERALSAFQQAQTKPTHAAGSEPQMLVVREGPRLNFVVQHWLGLKEALIGCFVAMSFSWSVIKVLGD